MKRTTKTLEFKFERTIPASASHNGMTGSRFAASRITLWIGVTNRGTEPHTKGSRQ
jgi:hypothetical protein